MDYHIYIHDKTNGKTTKATTPRTTGGVNTTPSKASSKESVGSLDDTFLATVKTGTATILAVYAAIKITDKAISTITPFVSRETGDYRFSIGYQNVKTTINNLTHPISWSLNQLTVFQETRLDAQRKEQQRLLLGESLNNAYGSRKV